MSMVHEVQKKKNIYKCTNAESNLERKNRANIYLFTYFLQIWTTFLKQINVCGIQTILNLYVLKFVEYFS